MYSSFLFFPCRGGLDRPNVVCLRSRSLAASAEAAECYGGWIGCVFFLVFLFTFLSAEDLRENG